MKIPACSTMIAMLACIGAVHAQTYPTKPVRFIVPQAPGGASDVLSRSIAHHRADADRTVAAADGG